MTRPEAEDATARMNAAAKSGTHYVMSYAGKGWRVERWVNGQFMDVAVK